MPTQSVYRVEKAKSSRSKCKGACKQAIPKDALRFGSAGDALHGTYFWRCMECITTQQVEAAESVHGSIEKIPGIDELPETERKAAIKRLQACKQEGDETECKDKRKDRAADKENIKPVEGAVLPEKSKGKSAGGKRKKAEAERGETGAESEGGPGSEEREEISGHEEAEGGLSPSEELPTKKAAVQA